MSGKHRGWFVKGTNSAEVSYRSKSSAKSVAKNVKGGKVSSGSGCAIIVFLPLLFAVVSVRAA